MTSARHLVRRFLTLGGTRLELLAVELQEEVERLVHVLLLALSLAVAGLLVALLLSATVVVLCWPWSPLGGLLLLTGLYTLVGLWLLRQLRVLRQRWKPLSATRQQLQGDRAGLEKLLS